MIRNSVIASALLLIACSAARGQDSFYAIIFGEQDGRNRINEAHSFATFVRVRLEAAGPEVVDRATISWLPAAGRVRLFKRAERGRNYTLEETFALVKPGHSVAQWGPFAIQEELFDRAKKQEAFLNSGGVLYKAMDPFTRPAGIAINCEHAISDIGLNLGESIIRTGTAHGHPGSYLVATHLRRWMIEPEVAHDWVGRSLQLDQYEIAKGGGWDYQGPGRTDPPTIAVASRTAPSGTLVSAAAEKAGDGVGRAAPSATAAPSTTEQTAKPAEVASAAREKVPGLVQWNGELPALAWPFARPVASRAPAVSTALGAGLLTPPLAGP